MQHTHSQSACLGDFLLTVTGVAEWDFEFNRKILFAGFSLVICRLLASWKGCPPRFGWIQ